MLLSYYIILPILEPFMFFSISYDHIACNFNLCDYLVIDVLLCFVTYVTIIYNITSHLFAQVQNKEKIKEK